MKIIAKENINVNGIIYIKGDEVKVNSKEQLIKLNERGYIEPLTIKEIQSFGTTPVWEQPKIINKKSKKEE